MYIIQNIFFNEVTGERRRIDKDLPLPDGFIYSIGMTEEHRQSVIQAAYKRRGKPSPWTIITNKNPEKIRKTAEKHRGMKRTQETKDKLKLAKLKFFEAGGVSNTKGKLKVFNKVTRKISYISQDKFDNLCEYPELSSEKLYRVTSLETGKHIYILPDEELPIGYMYAKNCDKGIK